MTKRQEETIEKIKKAIPEFDYYNHPEDHEIKEFNIEELAGTDTILVNFTTGRRNDEGTMAEVYCRKYRCFLIGKNGGIMLSRKNAHTLFRATVFELMNKFYTE